MKALLILQLFLMLVFGTAWGVNLYKLTQCDFVPSYKSEIIHAIGVIPVASIVTVWHNGK